MADEIERALAVVRGASPKPWEVREHEGLVAIAHPRGWVLEADTGAEADLADGDAIALLHNCGEELLEVLRWTAAREAEAGRLDPSGASRYNRALLKEKEAVRAALTRLRECLPEEDGR